MDVWDAERDARRWPGGCPVVAHPPCRAWGLLRRMDARHLAELVGAPGHEGDVALQMKMYDVIAVNMVTHKVRLLGVNRSERTADVIEMMSIARFGCDEEFFTKAPSGKYKEGDEWAENEDV